MPENVPIDDSFVIKDESLEIVCTIAVMETWLADNRTFTIPDSRFPSLERRFTMLVDKGVHASVRVVL
jgi:alpha-glucosidase (family GH31 glycosyl hydrolase)